MTTFLYVFIVFCILEIIGKGLMLKERDYTRKPGYMVGDIAVSCCFLLWAGYLLGSMK